MKEITKIMQFNKNSSIVFNDKDLIYFGGYNYPIIKVEVKHHDYEKAFAELLTKIEKFDNDRKADL